MSEQASRLQIFQSHGGFFHLGPRALLQVTGGDRVRYLNGQLSNDLRRLSPGRAMPALVLTAKGKLCAPVQVWIEGEAIWLETDPSLGETLLNRLERYAISDDVTFDLTVSEIPTWHSFGPAAVGSLEINRIGLPGFDRDNLPQALLETTKEEVEILRICQGVPSWGHELDENTLPQEALLERSAVDFNKGCYVGQETVSRLKSVGRVNRLLTGFLGNFSPVGEFSLSNTAGERVGRLTSVVALSDSQTAALGYLSTREEEQSFAVTDESGACHGRVERCEFPLRFP